MEKGRHTAGEWKVGFRDGTGTGEHDEGAWIVRETHASTIVVVAGGREDGRQVGVTGRSSAERDANARLIAAAPDLLEACRDLLTVKHTGAPEYADVKRAIERAEAAIRRATGST